MDNNIASILSVYLKNYADALSAERLDPSHEMIDILRKNPAEAFNVIVNSSFEVPANLDVRDLDDPLGRILSTMADLVPDLFIPKMTKGFWGTRWLYISSAAASKSPLFTQTIIDLLLDRSLYIKTLVLKLIVQWRHLQVAAALPKLEKLGQMQQFQNSGMDRELLEQARQCISDPNR